MEQVGEVQLPKGPRLENWYTLGTSLVGEIYGDTRGKFEDGATVRTSPVKVMGTLFAEMQNTKYLLGKPHKSNTAPLQDPETKLSTIAECLSSIIMGKLRLPEGSRTTTPVEDRMYIEELLKRELMAAYNDGRRGSL